MNNCGKQIQLHQPMLYTYFVSFIASPEWKRSYRIVKVLVKSGGNVNQAKTTDGASPLRVASFIENVTAAPS